jgi:hypothetical protein
MWVVMARIQWKENSLVSLKLREDLYTIALLKRSPYMWFFDISYSHGNWENVDFDKPSPLFCVLVGRAVTQKLAVEKISDKFFESLKALAIPSQWIKPLDNTADWQVDNFPWRGGRLIDLDPEVGSVDSPIVIPELDVRKHRDLIETCELTNMWGDQDLSDRLCRYFEAGVNRDDLKFEVFPGLWSDRDKLRPLTRRLPAPLR